ncbi:MAG: FliM/FliN family flagellar motor C-terminal domain-containing protein [Alteraurantiacibacter sp. bin_em_oilr2.035]|nr:FliM/FliN family flagellar motor C-terminal domain-containing protein [Alteraurantiacibacter sp. bin_em_oilr2.035]
MAQLPLARHSELLAKRPPETGELAKALGDCTTRLSAALTTELGELIGRTSLQVNIDKVGKAPAAKLHKFIAPAAANFQLVDTGGAQVLASLDYHSALVLTDQVFGGKGDWSAVSPKKLPASANMTLSRAVNGIGRAWASTFELSDALALRARSDVMGKFIPLSDPDTFFVFRAQITLNDAEPWHLHLVLREGHAALLLNDNADTRPARAGGDKRRPDAKPFADIPLPLTAMLARLELPVSRISNLRPGDTIPLAIGRNIALRLDDTEIARGEIGASDGALALRLTSIAWNKKDQINDR